MADTEKLRELPEPAAALHVQLFRNSPSMRNTDFVEAVDFPQGSHGLYTADQMREYAKPYADRLAAAEAENKDMRQELDATCEQRDALDVECARLEAELAELRGRIAEKGHVWRSMAVNCMTNTPQFGGPECVAASEHASTLETCAAELAALLDTNARDGG